jgi:threonine aldolase
MAPVESNAVFVHLPARAADRLQQMGWRFYPWDAGFRFMCAWDTQPETVDRFAADVAAAARN